MEARRAFEDFGTVARVRCTRWDLTLGRAGALLGYALQYEADPNLEPRSKPLGDRLATALVHRLAKFGSIVSSKKVETLSIAHGWAGGVTRSFAGHRRPAPQSPHRSSTASRSSPRTVGIPAEASRGHAFPIGAMPRAVDMVQGDAGMAFLWLLAAETLNSERFVDLAEGAAWMVASGGRMEPPSVLWIRRSRVRVLRALSPHWG